MGDDTDPLATVRRTRRRLADAGPEYLRSANDFERVSLPEADSDALRDLLIAEDARVVVEIGLAYGSSALAIGEALVSQGSPDAKHLIVDAFQEDYQNAGWDVVVAAGLSSLCTLMIERSQLALPRLLAEGLTADAGFVDGSHVFHHVFVDLYFLQEIVRPGGLIVLDDCHWPSVGTAARYFEVNASWHPQPMGQQTRLRSFRLPDPLQEPAFVDFRPFGDLGCSVGFESR